MQLHEKIWWTRKSRIHTEKRLLSNDIHTQIILLWYAFFSVAVSIYYLVKASNSDIAPGIWVILSVFSLVASSYVSALNLKGRAALIKECYERLDTLYHIAKSESNNKEKLETLQREYNEILGLCENHSDFDYRSARCEMHFSGRKDLDPEISKYDIAIWILHHIRRTLLLLGIYLSPPVILLYLEAANVCAK